MRRIFAAGILTVSVLSSSLMAHPAGAAPGAGPASGGVAVGIHDGSVNGCDNTEHWRPDGKGGKAAASVNGAAAQAAMISSVPVKGTPWFQGLKADVVRFSVPWDIALPDSPSASDQSLVTAGEPTAAAPDQNWSQLHFQALKNEQACFDWWLNEALKAGETVEVAFKPDYDYRDIRFGPAHEVTVNKILAPPIAVYRIAIGDFVKEYSQCAYGPAPGGGCALLSGPAAPPGGDGARVHIISPWGEPDYHSSGPQGNSLNTPSGNIPRSVERFYLPHGGGILSDPVCDKNGPRSTNTNWCGPVLAAQYYMAVSKACNSSCELTAGPAAGKPASGVIAGDFSSAVASATGRVITNLGTPVTQPYWQTYDQHLNNCAGCAVTHAWTWGVHPYADTSDWEFCTGNGHAYPPFSPYVTKTLQFAGDLHSLGYGPDTSIWLNEVSVYQHDMFKHLHGPAGCSGSTSYTPRREALAFQWLYRTLPASIPSQDPQVTQVIYYRASGQDNLKRNVVPGQNTCLYEAIKQRASLKTGKVPRGCDQLS
jgi:hypothetical protein